MGNTPVPTALRVLRGNPGKRALPKDEPQPDLTVPEPPAWLSPAARAHWLEASPELGRIGLLTAIDGAAYAEYCTVWARWQAAEQKILDEGPLVTVNAKVGPDGELLGGTLAASPYVTMANVALAQVRAFEVEFGKTPSSRSRVHVSGARPKTKAQAFADGAIKLRAARG